MINVHVTVVRSIRIVAVETSNIKRLLDFIESQNIHNSAFRYKLDTSYKNWEPLINKAKHIFQRVLRSNIEKLLLLLYNKLK